MDGDCCQGPISPTLLSEVRLCSRLVFLPLEEHVELYCCLKLTSTNAKFYVSADIWENTPHVFGKNKAEQSTLPENRTQHLNLIQSFQTCLTHCVFSSHGDSPKSAYFVLPVSCSYTHCHILSSHILCCFEELFLVLVRYTALK